MKGRSQLDAGAWQFPGEALCSSTDWLTPLFRRRLQPLLLLTQAGVCLDCAPCETSPGAAQAAAATAVTWRSTRFPGCLGTCLSAALNERRILDLGALLRYTLPPPFCSLSADSRNRLLNDSACVALKSIPLPKGSLLPNPCPPELSTLNSAKITEAPLALENRQPTHPGLYVQQWSSAINKT